MKSYCDAGHGNAAHGNAASGNAARRRQTDTPTDLRQLGNWPAAEAHFRGLLYAALARLAAAGYVVTIEEARDLILDFFLEEWSGLVARYKPQLAQPKTYVYRAFILYARPKIRRLRRWKNSLADVSRLARWERDETAVIEGTASLDVAAAIGRLPAAERAVFTRLLEGKVSLRELARSAGVTRYRVRELLGDAFGRVLVALGERKSLTDEEWRIAQALWREGKAPRLAARDLGVTTESIQACRTKVLDIMGRGIRAENRQRAKPAPAAARPKATGGIPMTKFAERLKEAIRRDTPTIWQEIAHDRQGFLEYLEEHDVELSPEEQQALDDRPETFVRLLEALGDNLDDALSAEEKQSADALIAAQDADERMVGEAFTHVLLPGLSDDLHNYSKYFHALHRIEEAELAYFNSRTDVRAAQAAGEFPEDLLSYGIAPLTLLYASTAPHNVWRDLVREGRITRDEPVRLFSEDDSDSTLPVSEVVNEIGMLVECDPATAKALYDYCFAIALDQHPFFWEGFAAEEIRGSVLLLAPTESLGVEERWKARVESKKPEYA